MNRDQIIQIARDAGAYECFIGMIGSQDVGAIRVEWLESFAAAIRAATKEEDAQICDDLWQDDCTAMDCRNAIRASK